MTGTARAQDPKAEATRRQSEASHPEFSAWVSANAGSGKTHVLARRVIRLLLAGTPPGRILCLTYTKAAAANMANRVLAILGRWVRLPDAELDAAIAETVGAAPDAALRARARRLFAAALETPGGLKIQTIHAFCGGLLHRFPFEADAAAGFRELDEVGRLDLMARIRAGLVIDATADPASPLGEALGRLTEDLSDQGLAGLLDAAIALRARILPLGGTAGARRAAAARALGLPPGTRPADIEAHMLAGDVLPRSEWPAFAAEMAQSDKKTDQERAADLRAAAEAQEEAAARASYRRVFFGSEGPRSDRNLLTKGLADRLPVLADALRAERDRLAALDDDLRAARTLERTEAALTLAAEAGRRYEAEKAARGLLDFDDLITKAAHLLGTQPTFVQYKLDQGIDHILVDEAQDTSPEQWRVVEGLATDFFSGEGARPGVKRTIFVVGDEKQSIFSFQGADPRAFGGMRSTFEQKAGKSAFRRVELPHSFRSAPGVLEAVDTIFARAEAHAGLTLDAVAPVHAAIRADAPALVEVWPTTVPDPRPQPDNWRRPLDEVAGDDPVSRLAARIAGFIRDAIATGLAIPSRQGRPMKAGDVLVLVRRRGRIFEAVIRALKELKDARVQVAGADRLVVAEHIAALDLMALGDVLVSPDDDLALAALLKSPLFGFTDDDLMALCPGRPGRLADALAEAGDGRAVAVKARLEGWRRQGLALRPFDFYARVLGRDGGRRAMLARLGPEAADVLDEFMALARAYEASEPPSLAGFLAFLRCGGAETKRDMESGRDEVRVMTVHGAKGLEAPLVILADTVDMPRTRTSGGLICVPGPDGEVPVLAPRKAEDPARLAAARAAAAARELEEHRRLLYVALTRAEDAVIVCGAETREAGKDKPHARPEGCWYDLVRAALEDDAQECPALGFEGTVLRWSKGPGLAVAGPAAPLPAAAGGPVAAFPHPAPAEAALRVLRPSRAEAPGPAPLRTPSVVAGGLPGLSPLVRGDLVHRLLAGLPDVPAAEREAAGLRLLRHAADGVADGLHREVLEEALGVLGHAPLADLFGAGSRAEVPVVGRLPALDGNPFHISGRVDRLAVQGGRILVADFKTDRTPPEQPGEVTEAYVAQLAVYGALLSASFGGLPFEARLIYTAGPRVFSLDAQRLAAALDGLGVSSPKVTSA
ncbi:double-strand break repair helicase AddA [Xanthobacter dioxanivorans]|uniref:DNA 3'-5' helicase n=1 Tax=Xanthobacter dioxanivorans TaxID=2528964 RepID=A0A974PU39_9HYPH|nr:double-strand break repair helicase AddA [Xanthobacter dioxanivorans]QRG09125.1 double-strand break repair helicase AddA [Xanthobacter dioxanivorans]